MLPERTRATDRRRRLIAGGGAGTGVGALAAVVVAWVYQESTGHQMGDQVAAAIGGLIGALASTVAICAQDLRELLRARIKRESLADLHRRKDDSP